ncbi:MAG: hypothetical protein VB125_05740, partial [Burkholderia sp.]
IGSCRGAQPHDGTCSSAVRPYCLRSKTWESLRPHVHLCNNAHLWQNMLLSIHPPGQIRWPRAFQQAVDALTTHDGNRSTQDRSRHRHRTCGPAAAGRGSRATSRRRLHRSVHRPLPQGSDG